jgi:thiol-disulfide isomerase/thioredoxin
MQCRSIKCLGIATAITLVMVPLIASGQDQFKVGTTSSYCASPTVIGPTQCQIPPAPPKPPKPSAKANRPPATPETKPQSDAPSDPIVGDVKESEVNDFLANYGKPSREAVRAILNPTDENIASLLKVERSQLAVTAYTAQRRVELTQATQAKPSSELSQADLPSLIGMRVTVIVSTECKGCEQILPLVNQLVTEFPSVDARLGVIGAFDAKQFVQKTAVLGVYLPTAKVSVDRAHQLNLDTLPAIIVGDIRYPGEAVLSEPIESALDLERAVVEVRRRNEKIASAAKVNTPKGEKQ